MNIRCIIVDDEPHAVDLLEMFVKEQTDWQVMAKCYNTVEALAELKKFTVDFLFLDINMPNLSGMELAEIMPIGTKIVFTTAHSEYAAESYSYNTIDYLLKPITLKRFLKAKEKIEIAIKTGLKEKQDVKSDEFFFKSGKTLRRLSIADILYFESEKEYVKLVTADEQLLIYRRMKDIEEQVGIPFVRVHNSYIINSGYIHKIQDNQIHIGGKKIPISEKYREHFMNIVREKTF